jgi:hypothetical protein
MTYSVDTPRKKGHKPILGPCTCVANSRNGAGSHKFYRIRNGRDCRVPGGKGSLKDFLRLGSVDGHLETKARLSISGC